MAHSGGSFHPPRQNMKLCSRDRHAHATPARTGTPLFRMTSGCVVPSIHTLHPPTLVPIRSGVLFRCSQCMQVRFAVCEVLFWVGGRCRQIHDPCFAPSHDGGDSCFVTLHALTRITQQSLSFLERREQQRARKRAKKGPRAWGRRTGTSWAGTWWGSQDGTVGKSWLRCASCVWWMHASPYAYCDSRHTTPRHQRTGLAGRVKRSAWRSGKVPARLHRDAPVWMCVHESWVQIKPPTATLVVEGLSVGGRDLDQDRLPARLDYERLSSRGELLGTMPMCPILSGRRMRLATKQHEPSVPSPTLFIRSTKTKS